MAVAAECSFGSICVGHAGNSSSTSKSSTDGNTSPAGSGSVQPLDCALLLFQHSALFRPLETWIITLPWPCFPHAKYKAAPNVSAPGPKLLRMAWLHKDFFWDKRCSVQGLHPGNQQRLVTVLLASLHFWCQWLNTSMSHIFVQKYQKSHSMAKWFPALRQCRSDCLVASTWFDLMHCCIAGSATATNSVQIPLSKFSLSCVQCVGFEALPNTSSTPQDAKTGNTGHTSYHIPQVWVSLFRVSPIDWMVCKPT